MAGDPTNAPDRQPPSEPPAGDPPAPQYRWINNRNLTKADLVGIGTAMATALLFAIWNKGCEGG